MAVGALMSVVRHTLSTIRLTLMIVRFTYRFFTGRPMSGERKTDATFWRPARHSLDPSGTALRWEMMRGAARLAWRLSGAYVLLLLPLLLLTLKLADMLTLTPWIAHWDVVLGAHALTALSVLIVWGARSWIREHGLTVPMLTRAQKDGERSWWDDWIVSTLRIEGRAQWMREKILPVSKSVSIILSTHIPERKAQEIVHIPRNYRDPGVSVEIMLPDTFTGADAGVKKRLVSSVSAKLGADFDEHWQMSGSAPRLMLTAPPVPPDMVSFERMRLFYENAAEYEFVRGITAHGEAVSVHLASDTPHDAVSAGSGAGKSELLKAKIMQALHRGWFVYVLDWKEESQQWCKGLPGVRYVSDIESMHDVCCALGEEIEYRKKNPLVERVHTLIVNEEWSISAPLLTEWWQIYRGQMEPEEKKLAPLRSPAVSAMMKIIYAGRSLKMFQTIVAIRFSARVTNGNADLRESFGAIDMARYKSQTVKMLAPDIKPFPRKSQVPGRWVLVIGDTAVVYQAPLITDDEAREWSTSGIRPPMSPFTRENTSGSGPLAAQRNDMITTQGKTLGDRLTTPNVSPNNIPHAEGCRGDIPLAIEGEVIERVNAKKLADMVDSLGHLGITLNILRHAAKSPESSFPAAFGGNQFGGYTYSLAEVREWAQRRFASQRVSQKVTK